MNLKWSATVLVTVSIIALLSACSSNQFTSDRSSEKSTTEKEQHVSSPPARPSSVESRAATPPIADSKLESTLGTVPAAGSALKMGVLQDLRPPSQPLDRERYAHFDANPVKLVAEHPVSTFSSDVDTGAYSNVRRMLKAGRLPVKDAVRIEELINYFSYAYPSPQGGEKPFHVTTEISATPWNTATHLLHIGIKGHEIPRDRLPPSNLVFLVDVSGSMKSPNKLDLLISALKLLIRQLDKEDRISIVVYAGASGVVLEPTAGDEKGKLIAALEGLTAGGSTNGGAGIRLAYSMAEQAYIEGGINRIILATDGDFNVGTVSMEALLNLIEDKRKSGISLTTLGFGTGNFNDQLMEQLADEGNGNYAYIDTLNEAQKVLIDEMAATLNTIAKDVKIQVEYNPVVVAEYRLIGYENRALRREDFSNDRVDAGEIGAGHTVTALYEIALAGGEGQRMEALRYGKTATVNTALIDELALLRLRYKTPEGGVSKLMERPILKADINQDLASATDRFRFSAAVAGFGQLLRGGRYMPEYGYDEVLDLARGSRGDDPYGYRGEFVTLVNLAASLTTPDRHSAR